MDQLWSITDEVHQSSDVGLDIRNVFLGISKGHDKVWHIGLKHNGISGNLLGSLSNFLESSTERVKLLVGWC